MRVRKNKSGDILVLYSGMCCRELNAGLRKYCRLMGVDVKIKRDYSVPNIQGTPAISASDLCDYLEVLKKAREHREYCDNKFLNQVIKTICRILEAEAQNLIQGAKQ